MMMDGSVKPFFPFVHAVLSQNLMDQENDLLDGNRPFLDQTCNRPDMMNGRFINARSTTFSGIFLQP